MLMSEAEYQQHLEDLQGLNEALDEMAADKLRKAGLEQVPVTLEVTDGQENVPKTAEEIEQLEMKLEQTAKLYAAKGWWVPDLEERPDKEEMLEEMLKALKDGVESGKIVNTDPF